MSQRSPICWMSWRPLTYTFYSEKYVWRLNYLFHSFQCCRQVLQTSTDPSQQFSAPFKAENSRQVQTCCKPQNTTQRKLTFSSLHQYRRNWSSHDLETQTINVTTLPAWACSHFHFWCSTSSGVFVAAEWNNAIITVFILLLQKLTTDRTEPW